MSQIEPEIGGDAPIAVDLEDGKTVWWCACGRSKTQPFCDGSHAGTGLEPVAFTPTRSKTYFLCTCKRTQRMPLCDGSHNALGAAPAGAPPSGSD